MKIRFCGVRGSTPAPGADFVAVGGHTSCLCITTAESPERPTLLLDAGTGIRSVSSMLAGAAFEGTILLTHLHWDHVQGLPFFVAADRPDARVVLLVPDEGVDALESLARSMSPPHFPIDPRGLAGRWTFDTIDEGRHVFEGLSVVAREVPHKGGRTFGYRVSDGRRTFAYIPDHRPALGGPGREAALDLCAGVDVLIHDAQFIASELNTAERFGHSTWPEAIELAVEAGARELILTHHGPDRRDTALSELIRALGTHPIPVSLAVQDTERML